MSKHTTVTVRAKRGTTDNEVHAAAQQAADRIEPGLTLKETSRQTQGETEHITFKGTRVKEDPTPEHPKGETWPHPVPASLPTSDSAKPSSDETGEQE